MNANFSLTDAQWTALTVAHHRALETQRSDRLFDDPLAKTFLDAAGAVGTAAAEAPAAPTDYFAVRTRFFDDYLMSVGCSQIVIVGAGLDSRAFRLHWPEDVRVFEIDQPAILDFKHSVVTTVQASPRCTRIPVATDLRTDWSNALCNAGFRREPTAWLAEGLLFYLTLADTEHLLRRISQLSPEGSRLAIEHINFSMSALMAPVTDQLRSLGAPWLSTIDAPGPWLAEFGWRSSVSDHGEAGARYGRPMPDFGTDPRAWLIEAVRDSPQPCT